MTSEQPAAAAVEMPPMPAEAPVVLEMPANIGQAVEQAHHDVQQLKTDGMSAAEAVAQRAGVAIDTTATSDLSRIGTQADTAVQQFQRAAQQPAGEKVIIDNPETVGLPATPEQAFRRNYEYRDASGKLLGFAEVQLSPEQAMVTRADRAQAAIPVRELKSFVLKGTVEGKESAVDVMQMVNPHNVRILVAETDDMPPCGYAFGSSIALVPRLDNPVAVGIAMHELGHANQDHDQQQERLVRYYGAQPAFDTQTGMLDQSSQRILTDMLRDIPEIAEKIAPEDRALLERSVQHDAKVSALIETWKALRAADPEVSSLDTATKLEAVVKDIDHLDAAYQQDAASLADTLRQYASLMRLPLQILERGATRWAFQKARAIREKSGVDLFEQVKLPAEKTVSRLLDEACDPHFQEQAQVSGEPLQKTTSLREELVSGLETHRSITTPGGRKLDIPRGLGRSPKN